MSKTIPFRTKEEKEFLKLVNDLPEDEQKKYLRALELKAFNRDVFDDWWNAVAKLHKLVGDIDMIEDSMMEPHETIALLEAGDWKKDLPTIQADIEGAAEKLLELLKSKNFEDA